MKKTIRTFNVWIRDTGSWIMLLLSASAGIMLASFPQLARQNLKPSRLIATIVVAIVSAGGLVTFESVRKSDRTVRSLHLWHRMGSMFMAGLSSVALTDSIFEAITRIFGSIN